MLYLSFRVPPLVQADQNGCWNFNQLSIGFAFRLRLRSDLPYVDQRCVGNLRFSARRILTDVVATYANILTRHYSIAPYRYDFNANDDAPLPIHIILFNCNLIGFPFSRLMWVTVKREQAVDPAASVICFSPVYFPRGTPEPVSYYALFKGWLLPSQPPGCLGNSTSFHT